MTPRFLFPLLLLVVASFTGCASGGAASGRTPAGEIIDASQADEPPVLLQNGDDFARLLKRYYPRGVRLMEPRVSVQATFVVLPSGRATQVRLLRSSGYVELDQATLDVVRQLRFRPARLGGQDTSSRVTLPITWQAPG